MSQKVKHIIILILKIIFFPIYLPWKLLFGRKLKWNGDFFQKFGIVSINILKGFVFLIVLFLELFAVHKIRYSTLTYGFTRNSLREYYLSENFLYDTNDVKLQQEFEEMLEEIDNWEIEEKNKISVILNSDLVRKFLKYTDDRTISYIVKKFNTEEIFRNNLKKLIKNIDSDIMRFINEIPSDDMDRLNKFIKPIVNVASWAIDYAGALNIGSEVFDYYLERYNWQEKSLYASNKDIENAIRSAIDFDNGASLETVKNYW